MKQALLVIDAQQELIDGNDQEPSVYHKEELIQNINHCVERAYALGHPVVFIRDLCVSNGEGDGFQVHHGIEVPLDAQIFDKEGTNSFYQTPLLGWLKDHEIEHVVITGCKTDYCVDTAVRAATVNGFDVTLVADGHGTTDNSVLSAEQIIQHHNEILHGYDNVEHFSMVRKSAEDLFAPLHDTYR